MSFRKLLCKIKGYVYGLIVRKSRLFIRIQSCVEVVSNPVDENNSRGPTGYYYRHYHPPILLGFGFHSFPRDVNVGSEIRVPLLVYMRGSGDRSVHRPVTGPCPGWYGGWQTRVGPRY